MEAPIQRADDEGVLEDVVVGGRVAFAIEELPLAPPGDSGLGVTALHQTHEDERVPQSGEDAYMCKCNRGGRDFSLQKLLTLNIASAC